MPREVDERRKRAALRKLRRAAALAQQGLGPPLSDWERAFLEEVEGRVEKYGAAFRDPHKGESGEALSGLQQQKLREIGKKARGKASRGLKAKRPISPKRSPRGHRAGDGPQPEVALLMEAESSAPARRPALAPVPDGPPSTPNNVTSLRRRKPQLTLIEGGAGKTEN